MYLHPLIASVPSDERTEFVQRIKLRSYRHNEVVLSASEWTDGIYCVANGLLRVAAPGSGSASDVTTDFIGQDDFFLGPALNEAGYQPGVTLVAALPSSVYLVPISELLGLCSKYPGVTMGLLELTMERTTMFRKQLRRIASARSERLISRILHELTLLAPVGAHGYDKRISQSVIASYSGRSRKQVNKTMRDLESRGLVRRGEHGLHIHPHFASSDFQELPAIEKSQSKVQPSEADSASFEASARADRSPKG